MPKPLSSPIGNPPEATILDDLPKAAQQLESRRHQKLVDEAKKQGLADMYIYICMYVYVSVYV